MVNLAGLGGAALAADDRTACAQAIAYAERTTPMPHRMLAAIALAESGRIAGGRVVAWPWTINADGMGQFFDTKAEAIATVLALQRSGVRSIDVGCLQISLQYHPQAFASLEDAFDPATNAAYAVRYLADLFRAGQSWPKAISAYHSSTPALGDVYLRKVLAFWTVPPELAGAFAAVHGPSKVADPLGIYTRAFADRLAAEAAERRLRDRRLGSMTAAPPAQLIRNRRGPAWPATASAS